MTSYLWITCSTSVVHASSHNSLNKVKVIYMYILFLMGHCFRLLSDVPRNVQALNNNNNNKHDNVYGAVIMAEPLREFTRFIW